MGPMYCACVFVCGVRDPSPQLHLLLYYLLSLLCLFLVCLCVLFAFIDNIPFFRVHTETGTKWSIQSCVRTIVTANVAANSNNNKPPHRQSNIEFIETAEQQQQQR